MTAARAEFDVEAVLAEIISRVGGELDALAREAPGELAAVVLGGGYGRGEGGVFTAANGSRRLYNDLDFFVFVHDRLSAARKNWWRDRLKQIDDALTPCYGVEVEFGPPTALGDLGRLTPTLMYQELVRGMRPVRGDFAAVRDGIAEMEWWTLPPEEGARLLLNRGAGLWLSAGRMAGATLTDGDRDFAVRNIHKAALAIGDGWLLARGLYEFGLMARSELLRRDPEFSRDALLFYDAAVKFKFSPWPDPAPDLAERWCRVTELYLKAVTDYRRLNPPRLPRNVAELAKNVIRNGRGGGCDGWKERFLHPRCRLQRILSALLIDKLSNRRYISIGDELRKNGKRKSTRRIEHLEALFLSGWRRFN